MLKQRLFAYLQGRELFVQDCYASADPQYCIGLRVITEKAWHSLFARSLFIRSPLLLPRVSKKKETYLPTPSSMPQIFTPIRASMGRHSATFIVTHLAQKLILIGGTAYAGDFKKSVFSLLNYLLPQVRVLSMHCSANEGPANDVALFFGLSGTGKTTL